MTHVVTLISNPDSPIISEDLIAKAASLLNEVKSPEILSKGTAVDLHFTPDGEFHKRTLEAGLREALNPMPVDVAVQESAGRFKKLLIADMDSTMIGQECIDELGAEIGIKDRIAEITERAMRGEIEYEPSLRERVALLRGIDISVVDEVIRKRITLNPGAVKLVGTMRQNGGYCALVSSGFTVFTRKIAEMIGFDENQGNELVVEEGVLTGEVCEPILEKNAKKRKLLSLMKQLGIQAGETMAVGDGANDLEMLGCAGLGVAIHAKPVVAESADVRIEHSDLTSLLYLQGYKDDEICSK